MDFATEQKLCRLADDVWRRVAAEDAVTADGRRGDDASADPKQDARTLPPQDVFARDARNGAAAA